MRSPQQVRLQRVALFAVLGHLAACLPDADAVRDGPLALEVVDVWSMDVDARLPSDLLYVDGQLVVLDGYQGRALVYNEQHELTNTLGTSESFGRPVRLALASAGGFWLVDPKQGLRRVDMQGVSQQSFGPDVLGPAFEPMAVLDLGDDLVVSSRDGEIGWFNSTTGAVRASVTQDSAGRELGAVSDLVPAPDGQMFAVDLIGGRIHVFSAGGSAEASFGRFGMWTGYMHKPKGAAMAADGSMFVADSALGVQGFSPDDDLPGAVGIGRVPLGPIVTAGVPLEFEHAIAIESVPGKPNQFVVLDQQADKVWGFTVAQDTLAQARADHVRALRRSLATQEGRIAGVGESTCEQCHDGLLNDSREVWDKTLFRHPVDIKPKMEIPAFFPLSEDGMMRCVTCHSPHGTTSLEDAKSVRNSKQVVDLIRHHPEDQLFTRLTRDDSALCIACHGEDPHAKSSEKGGHPTGSVLVDLLRETLAKQGKDAGADTKAGCLTCHAMHGASSTTLTRSSGEGGICVTCHADQGIVEKNHPVGSRTQVDHMPREGSEIPSTPVGGPQCESCHQLAGGAGEALLRRPKDGGIVCVACHDDKARLADEMDNHSNVRGENGILCLGCHQVHGADQSRHLMVATSTLAGDPNGCLSCHAPGRPAAVAGVSPGRAGHLVDGKTHDKVTLVCATCHDSHEPTPGPAAECKACHEKRVAELKHGDATCDSCHSVHADPKLAGGAAAKFNPIARRCLGCHSPDSAVGKVPSVPVFQHEPLKFAGGRSRTGPLLALALYGPNGQQVPSSENGDVTCATCHNTHAPDPSGLTELRKNGVKEACKGCHGDDIEERYSYYHEPAKRQNLDVWEN